MDATLPKHVARKIQRTVESLCMVEKKAKKSLSASTVSTTAALQSAHILATKKQAAGVKRPASDDQDVESAPSAKKQKVTEAIAVPKPGLPSPPPSEHRKMVENLPAHLSPQPPTPMRTPKSAAKNSVNDFFLGKVRPRKLRTIMIVDNEKPKLENIKQSILEKNEARRAAGMLRAANVASSKPSQQVASLRMAPTNANQQRVKSRVEPRPLPPSPEPIYAPDTIFVKVTESVPMKRGTNGKVLPASHTNAFTRKPAQEKLAVLKADRDRFHRRYKLDPTARGVVDIGAPLPRFAYTPKQETAEEKEERLSGLSTIERMKQESLEKAQLLAYHSRRRGGRDGRDGRD